ncbi:MAG TPA: exo-beta-N-acetylmuramidase NamZ domain-containing protein [Planctomycetota bacterium]|jgi:uncharacterized protein YbbC (DUF1343 family)
MRIFYRVACVVALLGCVACEPPKPAPVAPVQPPQPAAQPQARPAALDAAKLAAMDAAIRQAIGEQKLPGAVLWVEHRGERYVKAFGNRALVPARETMSEDTIFDAASLTKSIATAPSIILLIERGKLKLDEPVRTYLPEFTGEGRESVTLRHLLTHTSGLPAGLTTRADWTGYQQGVERCCAEKLQSPPGTAFRYSDVGFVLLGEIVRRVSGSALNEFAAREIYGPLKMSDTRFLQPKGTWARVAPTELRDGQVLRGTVHDPKAERMGGVAGHAGVFTTAADLARFARMLLAGGELDGVRVLSAESIKLMTSVQSPPGLAAKRGLGWDIDSGYSKPRGTVFPLGSYGHTGFTGTAIWIDPGSQTFWIFLSNRVHPDGKGNVLALETMLGTLAAEAAGLTAAGTEARPTVLNGIDVLEKHQYAELKGLRIGLITNQTGIDRQRNRTIDLLHKAPGVTLKALFSPEHGIRGEIDASVGDSIDEPTGLPVYSLYGKTRAPQPEQLKDLDALVFDIQDIGCRFYTYISTLGLALEAAGKANIKFIVLDRVNPINGVSVEGPLHEGASSFTAFHRLPVRHGMTVGELARMFNAERGINAALTVIPIEGWTRTLWFDETGQPWTNPSPNMRRLTAAILYPGLGLLESALSVGRGTDTPFEIIGAPYINDVALAAELNRAGLAGVRFVPVCCTPTASIHKDQRCFGVSILITDRRNCQSVDVGLTIAQALHRLYPKDFNIQKVGGLLCSSQTISALAEGKALNEIKKEWQAGVGEFQSRRAKALLYP